VNARDAHVMGSRPCLSLRDACGTYRSRRRS
jgi:hypothetical protein